MKKALASIGGEDDELALILMSVDNDSHKAALNEIVEEEKQLKQKALDASRKRECMPPPLPARSARRHDDGAESSRPSKRRKGRDGADSDHNGVHDKELIGTYLVDSAESLDFTFKYGHNERTSRQTSDNFPIQTVERGYVEAEVIADLGEDIRERAARKKRSKRTDSSRMYCAACKPCLNLLSASYDCGDCDHCRRLKKFGGDGSTKRDSVCFRKICIFDVSKETANDAVCEVAPSSSSSSSSASSSSSHNPVRIWAPSYHAVGSRPRIKVPTLKSAKPELGKTGRWTRAEVSAFLKAMSLTPESEKRLRVQSETNGSWADVDWEVIASKVGHRTAAQTKAHAARCFPSMFSKKEEASRGHEDEDMECGDDDNDDEEDNWGILERSMVTDVVSAATFFKAEQEELAAAGDALTIYPATSSAD